MNKIPNPNYPLPEKWYVQRTLENAEKLNKICNHIYPSKRYSYGTNEGDYDKLGVYTKSHFIHSIENSQDRTTRKKPHIGYVEVTYEDLWLAYMIPEKWYCDNIDLKNFERWRKLNNMFIGGGSSKYLVLSKHLSDNSYFWGGTLEGFKNSSLYKDYKEISKETYLELLNILEQNKNTKSMKNNTPTEVIIPITEFTKIVNVACPAWQKKLKDYVISNLQDDYISVKVTKGFYDQMITASTVRDGINQADVINSVLPMFKHDPYKVFRDAEKEGKTIQVFNMYQWLDIKNPIYNNKSENYRIKHKHQDLIDEWEASGRTKVVQWLSVTDTWKELLDNNPSWLEDTEYRFKHEPKYVPFDDSEIQQLMGEWIRHKVTGEMIMITEVYPPSHGGGITVKVVGGRTSLYVIFDQYTFLDGSPCGKPVQK